MTIISPNWKKKQFFLNNFILIIKFNFFRISCGSGIKWGKFSFKVSTTTIIVASSTTETTTTISATLFYFYNVKIIEVSYFKSSIIFISNDFVLNHFSSIKSSQSLDTSKTRPFLSFVKRKGITFLKLNKNKA